MIAAMTFAQIEEMNEQDAAGFRFGDGKYDSQSVSVASAIPVFGAALVPGLVLLAVLYDAARQGR